MTSAAHLFPARLSCTWPLARSRRFTTRRATILAVGLALAPALSGCSTPVDVPPAEAASDPMCARILRATPDQIEGHERRTATAQSATAWGDPAITVRCGVPVPGPSTDRCLSIELPDGRTMDWLHPEDGSAQTPTSGAEQAPGAGTQQAPEDGGAWTFVTYGRDPAVEVRIPAGTGIDQPTAVLVELANAVDLVEPTRACVGATDVPLG